MRQRNTKDENDEIKEGKTPKEWEKKKNRNKKAQKDVNARWITKNKERHYGYKNHVNVDKKSKIITKYRVTSAEIHDSQELKNLINKILELKYSIIIILILKILSIIICFIN